MVQPMPSPLPSKPAAGETRMMHYVVRHRVREIACGHPEGERACRPRAERKPGRQIDRHRYESHCQERW